MRLLAFILICLPFCFIAQEANGNTYKNEFGIDATSFVLRFIKLNSEESTYLETYDLTYRRKFEPGNIRFAIGGNFADEDVPPVFEEDQNKYKYEASTFNARIGWEFKSEISKKWQVFYGADFRPSFQRIKEDATMFNAGYANGYESKVQNYGIAPVLGFRFRLNERLSLSTEASFSVNMQKENTTFYYTPITTDYEPKESFVQPTVHRTFSRFAQPVMIFVTFDI